MRKSFLNLKNIIISSAVVLSLSVFGCATITRIDVGHVGVKVKLAGTARGVQDVQLKTGWVWYNPLTEQVIEFPTRIENLSWTKDPHEGLKKDEKPNPAIDESITFSSKEGVNVNADIGFSFHIQPEQAPKLYTRFRQNDMHELAYGYMRNVVRDAFNETASKLTIQDIYGVGKSQMLTDVLARCRNVLGEDGIVVDQLTINGSLRLPPNVAEAINNAMAATQMAIQSENKVRQVQAEADQKIAAAKGEAEAARQRAQGESDALLIKTDAEAKSRLVQAESQSKANKMLNNSLTPQVIQIKTIEQWNGVMPLYQGGGTPLISIK